MSTLTKLYDSVNSVNALEKELRAAREQRDALIVQYLSEGATVYGTAKLLGTSRQAVMKIRDAAQVGDAPFN